MSYSPQALGAYDPTIAVPFVGPLWVRSATWLLIFMFGVAVFPMNRPNAKASVLRLPTALAMGVWPAFDRIVSNVRVTPSFRSVVVPARHAYSHCASVGMSIVSMPVAERYFWIWLPEATAYPVCGQSTVGVCPRYS